MRAVGLKLDILGCKSAHCIHVNLKTLQFSGSKKRKNGSGVDPLLCCMIHAWSTVLFKKYLFVYLAVRDLGCGTCDLQSLLQHSGSLAEACEI